jgi:cation transport regulator ChaC
MKRIGILAYGSLIDNPGEEIAAAKVDVIQQGISTPFNVEFARTSKTREGAPTLVPVTSGGGPVDAQILVVNASQEEAAHMLYRRETGRVGQMNVKYRRPANPGINSVLVERIENFKGVDVVLYTSIGATIEKPTATKLAELAIESAKKLHNGTDGISYLINAIKNGIHTPLTDAYVSEVKRLTAVELDEAALLIMRRARRAMKHPGPTIVPPFEQIVSVDQISTLRDARTVIAAHPLVSVALHPGEGQYPSQTSSNTTQALEIVLNHLPAFAKGLKARLVDTSDWTNAESALAEIRACGALLEAGYNVKIGAKTQQGSRPEFEAIRGGTRTIVEVWGRNLALEDQAVIENDLRNPSSHKHGSVSISTGVTVVAPFGVPNKPGDTVTLNVINRVASIKRDEHQVEPNTPFVVWVDLQSVGTLAGFDNESQFLPIENDRGELSSGGYWYGLYGRKADVIFQRGSASAHMGHEGRYFQTMKHGASTRVSAFIFSTPKHTIIMENPKASNPLPDAFRNGLLQLPRFDIGLSLANWSAGHVIKVLDVQRTAIAGLTATADTLKKKKRS